MGYGDTLGKGTLCMYPSSRVPTIMAQVKMTRKKNFSLMTSLPGYNNGRRRKRKMAGLQNWL
jgi:hypothetical protein